MQILGISADHPFAQKTFAESLQLPYPLLSDFPKLETIRSYGVLSPNTQITALRSFFLVDQQGTVRQRWIDIQGVFPSETALEAVRAILRKP